MTKSIRPLRPVAPSPAVCDCEPACYWNMSRFGAMLMVLLLGAHFFRADAFGLVLCCAGVLTLVCSKIVWKQYAAAFFLFWGTLEWGETLYALADMRMQMQQPWVRGAAILGGVGVLTFLSGLAVFFRAQKRQPHGHETALFQGIVFMCTFYVLLQLDMRVSLDLFLLERYFPGFGRLQLFLSAWYAAWAAGKLLDVRTSRIMRQRLWLVFACVFFTQCVLGLLGMENMFMTGTLHVPVPAFIVFGPVFRGAVSMMPWLVLLSAMLVGSAWCSMLCYFGPFDALLASRKRTVQPLPRWLQYTVRYGRASLLAGGVLVALALRLAGATTAMALLLAGVFSVAGVLVMVLFSRRYGSMVHCTSFCPMGLIVNVLGRLAPWRVRVDTARCDNCGACEKICRYRAITAESRRKGCTLWRCALCRDCLPYCRKNALFLYSPFVTPERAVQVFVGIVTVLHVIFLTVARV